MIDTARAKASVEDACHWMLSPDWGGLDGLGMGLSGCEDEHANKNFVQLLLERYPKLSKYGHCVSDTIGSIYTACPDGKSCPCSVTYGHVTNNNVSSSCLFLLVLFSSSSPQAELY